MGRSDVDKVIIRLATDNDSQAIAQLWEKLIDYHYALDDILPRPVPNGAEIYLQQMILREYDPRSRVLVAEAKGEVIGYVLGMIVDLVPEMFVQESSGFLVDIFVDEAYRGHGVGRALVDTLADWFREQGLKHYEWYVASCNHETIAFWQRLGGRDVMIRMRKELDNEEKDD